MATAVPATHISNDEYRDWIIQVMGFLNAVLGVRLVYEVTDPDEVGRYNIGTREITARIGAHLEDLAWLLNEVLDEYGAGGLFELPGTPQRRPHLRLVLARNVTSAVARPAISAESDPGRTPELRAPAQT